MGTPDLQLALACYSKFINGLHQLQASCKRLQAEQQYCSVKLE